MQQTMHAVVLISVGTTLKVECLAVSLARSHLLFTPLWSIQ